MGGSDGATDRVRPPPGSVKLSAGTWIPPPSVTAQRVSALCLSAFLGQDDHSTAAAAEAATHRHNHSGRLGSVCDHKCKCLCSVDTRVDELHRNKIFKHICVCWHTHTCINLVCCLLCFCSDSGVQSQR